MNNFIQGALIAALSTSFVSAISFTVTCDEARSPSWDACSPAFDAINNAIGANGGNLPISGEGISENCNGYESSGNCVVAVCDNLNQGYVDGNVLTDAINAIQTDCEPYGAGGNAVNTDGIMSASVYSNNNNPTRRSPNARRTRLKRDDQTWTTGYRIDNAAPEFTRQQVLSAQPGGSSWTLTSEESQTNRVEASFSIDEGFFDIFSASESLSYSYEETVTTSSSTNNNNKCGSGQSGTLFWYPLFTQYYGGYSPDGPTGVSIYVPITESDGSAAGKYVVTCAG